MFYHHCEADKIRRVSFGTAVKNKRRSNQSRNWKHHVELTPFGKEMERDMECETILFPGIHNRPEMFCQILTNGNTNDNRRIFP